MYGQWTLGTFELAMTCTRSYSVWPDGMQGEYIREWRYWCAPARPHLWDTQHSSGTTAWPMHSRAKETARLMSRTVCV